MNLLSKPSRALFMLLGISALLSLLACDTPAIPDQVRETLAKEDVLYSRATNGDADATLELVYAYAFSEQDNSKSEALLRKAIQKQNDPRIFKELGDLLLREQSSLQRDGKATNAARIEEGKAFLQMAASVGAADAKSDLSYYSGALKDSSPAAAAQPIIPPDLARKAAQGR